MGHSSCSGFQSLPFTSGFCLSFTAIPSLLSNSPSLSNGFLFLCIFLHLLLSLLRFLCSTKGHLLILDCIQCMEERVLLLFVGFHHHRSFRNVASVLSLGFIFRFACIRKSLFKTLGDNQLPELSLRPFDRSVNGIRLHVDRGVCLQLEFSLRFHCSPSIFGPQMIGDRVVILLDLHRHPSSTEHNITRDDLIFESGSERPWLPIP
mmetsp:Transcript_32441/g.74540  ORF Transcript_32441/g.74540 Transcript_32441/m.74540 type:complete len:206 (-) Transcript_32441:793-1410(-)